MVKATLMIALMYFLSPIAIANIQAKSMNTEGPRQEFFKPQVETTRKQMASQSVPQTSAEPKTAAAAKTQTLCAGVAYSANLEGTFCAAYVSEPVMTLNNLESTGLYACEKMVQPEFNFEMALTLGRNEMDLTVGQKEEEASEVNQCSQTSDEMTDISQIVSRLATAMN